LLDQIRDAALAHYGRPDPAERCVAWSRRFILFHGKRHARDRGAAEVVRFLEYVAASDADAVNALLLAHEDFSAAVESTRACAGFPSRRTPALV
jgi:hypothetical protein